jgi:hypothetical protein
VGDTEPCESGRSSADTELKVIPALVLVNSALMLVAAPLRHIAGTKWGLKQYLKMDRLEEEIREIAA